MSDRFLMNAGDLCHWLARWLWQLNGRDVQGREHTKSMCIVVLPALAKVWNHYPWWLTTIDPGCSWRITMVPGRSWPTMTVPAYEECSCLTWAVKAYYVSVAVLKTCVSLDCEWTVGSEWSSVTKPRTLRWLPCGLWVVEYMCGWCAWVYICVMVM